MRLEGVDLSDGPARPRRQAAAKAAGSRTGSWAARKSRSLVIAASMKSRAVEAKTGRRSAP